ncbi:GATA transcription factor 19-like [Bidens hawaiensis]|uniref:GATA transcription factor 19-like n=1 Tax=Bidens hawaiensis TaxID=980011 RepID=UPI00404A361D
MNRCTGATMMGPCSCGLYHYHQPNSFSNMFPMSYDYDQQMCAYGSSSPSSVDCTLSLGTPSTRSTHEYEKSSKTHHENRRGSSWWNILQPSSHSAAPSPRKANHGGAAGDSLFSRRCANCDTTSTPLWRNGPRGPKSLCNACGIRYKKEERRANKAAAATVTYGSDATEGYHHQYMMNSNQWVNHDYSQSSSHKMSSCYSPAASNEFRFIDDVDDRDSTFLSWRLNFTDRPGLVHDFTR